MSADPKAPEPPTDADLTRMHGVSPSEVAAEYAEAMGARLSHGPAAFAQARRDATRAGVRAALDAARSECATAIHVELCQDTTNDVRNTEPFRRMAQRLESIDAEAIVRKVVTAAEAVNAEPPATPEMRNVAGDATPDGPDWSTEPGIDPRGALAKPTPALSGAGSGEQSRPATPEPAAPMPRVSDADIADILSRGLARMGLIFSGTSPTVTIGEALFDLRDSRSRESALRAKVAELEARIADIHEALGENAGSDDASLPASIRWTLADHRNALEESEAALARANEALAAVTAALRHHRADLHQWSRRPCPTCRQSADALGIRSLVPDACARMESDNQAFVKLAAQGSAAQKPEGP